MFQKIISMATTPKTEWSDPRPDWDAWFMSMAFVASGRSLDPSTQHGSIAISEDRSILTMGYNGPPRGCVDSEIPLTRPAKYAVFCHSEEAAIANAARHGIRLNGCTFYITGHPCESCFRELINVGAKKIIYGPVGSHCVTEESKSIVQQMLKGQDIAFVAFDCSKLKDVSKILETQLERVKAIIAEESQKHE